jgi:hypothetical protein
LFSTGHRSVAMYHLRDGGARTLTANKRVAQFPHDT